MIWHQHFHDSGSEPFTYCTGIDATVSWDESIHQLVKTARRDQLVYFSANVQGTTVFTNDATGKTYTKSTASPTAIRRSSTTVTAR